MTDNESAHNYVDRVRDETQLYVRGLLQENEALRIRVAQLESTAAELDQKIQEIRRESEQYLGQYAQVEQQNANLANLYVASYQLHGTLDREAVLGAIQEIVVNLVGSEEFGVYELDPLTEAFAPIAGFGLDLPRDLDLRLEPIARAASGELHVAEPDGSLGPAACVPLKIDGRVTGMIVINRLLAHKVAFEPLDHELFDLLATHAATALYCSRLEQRTRLIGGATA